MRAWCVSQRDDMRPASAGVAKRPPPSLSNHGLEVPQLDGQVWDRSRERVFQKERLPGAALPGAAFPLVFVIRTGHFFRRARAKDHCAGRIDIPALLVAVHFESSLDGCLGPPGMSLIRVAVSLIVQFAQNC